MLHGPAMKIKGEEGDEGDEEDEGDRNSIKFSEALTLRDLETSNLHGPCRERNTL